MKAILRDTFERFFPVSATHLRAYTNLLGDRHSYLYLTGWMQSLQERRPVDGNGDPIPWMNFPAVRLLEERLTPDLNLFEFGSGYSTLFYARRVGSVTAVEHDEEWFGSVNAQAPGNVKLLFQEQDVNGAYCRIIGSLKQQYDVVIVDGRDRVNCIAQSLSALTARGVIVLDDSQRDRYQEGLEFARSRGFRALNLEGLKAMAPGIDRTTFLYRDNNCLGI